MQNRVQDGLNIEPDIHLLHICITAVDVYEANDISSQHIIGTAQIDGSGQGSIGRNQDSNFSSHD